MKIQYTTTLLTRTGDPGHMSISTDGDITDPDAVLFVLDLVQIMIDRDRERAVQRKADQSNTAPAPAPQEEPR